MQVEIELLRRLRGDDPGTIWKVTYAEALILTHRGYAKYVRGNSPIDLAAEPLDDGYQIAALVAAKTPMRKRQYRRRDMTAE